MKRNSFLFLLIFFAQSAISQMIVSPASAYNSHETLLITRIENTKNELRIWCELTSYIEQSGFCLDKNTWIVLQDGSRLKMRKSEGMPNCPKQFTFNDFGEVCRFMLLFPPLPEGTVSFDLEEECDANCVRIIGIVSETALNLEYLSALQALNARNLDIARDSFIKILDNSQSHNIPLRSSIFGYIINILYEQGNLKEAQKYLRLLQTEKPPYSGEILRELKKLDLLWVE